MMSYSDHICVLVTCLTHLKILRIKEFENALWYLCSMKVALLADYSVFPYLFKNFTYSFVKRCAYSHYMNLGEKNNFPTDKIKFLWFSTNLVPGFFKQEADI